MSSTANPGNKPIRLQLFMARAGVASRRKCEELIAEGLVKVNGKVVLEPGTKVGPEDRVTYAGRRLETQDASWYVALNKPPRYLCTNDDPEGRPLAIGLLRGLTQDRLFHVGRLDFLSTGLVFYTNNGEFADAVQHPRNEVEKEYIVETREDISDSMMEEFVVGVHVEGERYRIQSWNRRTSNSVFVVLVEGKNRELRKLFGSRRLKVKRIHRIRIGHIRLKGIASGSYRLLKPQEVQGFLKKADPRPGKRP